jgi:tRNA modification GTPase
MVEALIHLRTQIEAAIDFPEEEIDFLADTALQDECRSLKESIDRLLADTRQGCLLHDGMTIVLAGRPNAGKSSLMNALAQRDTAIVSPVPGTTRDTLREHIQIDGMPLHLIDTAGLRDTGDEIESEGVRRAQQAMQRADRVLLLLDDSDATTETFDAVKLELPPGVPCTVVRNKIDKSGRAPGVAVPPDKNGSATEIALSALTGAGLPALREHLKACMGFQSAGSGTFSARRRHLDAMQRARRHVVDGLSRLEQKQGDLAAEELRLAQQALGEITGEFAADDLLGRIFSSFCIGK